MGETSRQLNIQFKKHEQYSKHVLRCPVDLDKLENRSAIALHPLATGHKINFKVVKILQEGFDIQKEKITVESL